MRMRLPSRLYLFLFCVVSVLFGYRPSAFAAENSPTEPVLRLSSFTNIAGLTFQQPAIQEINQDQIIQYDFSTQPTQSLTIDSEPTIHTESTLLSQDILTPSFVLDPIDSPPLSPTPTMTPTPTKQTPATTSSITPSPTPSTTPTIPTSVTPSPTVTQTPTLTPTSTPIPTLTPTLPPIPPATDIDGYFVKYSDQYHVDVEVLRRIARCESGYNAHAQNLDYGGMFQFATNSWIVTRQAMGADTDPNLRFSAEESIRTAAFKISRDGTSAWPSC